MTYHGVLISALPSIHVNPPLGNTYPVILPIPFRPVISLGSNDPFRYDEYRIQLAEILVLMEILARSNISTSPITISKRVRRYVSMAITECKNNTEFRMRLGARNLKQSKMER